jgi:DNA adenine methylase
VYCEPYAGGAGLAIRLLTNGFVERVSINDIDRSIYAFWISALYKTDAFCALVEDTPITIDEWHQQRDVWIKGDMRNKLRLGFAAFFLNRTNRSGIIDGAGPIGGYSQVGKWKIDARLVKDRQIANLIELSAYRNQIEVSNLDALEYFRDKAADPKTFTYLDPPYYVKGQKLYKNFYQHDDHIRIADELRRCRTARWVVSYDDVPAIRSAYKAFSPLTYFLNYSAGEKAIGTEVMYSSDTVIFPEVAGYWAAA